MKSTIPHKIWKVPDEVCLGKLGLAPSHKCSQLYENECRAYSMPHSKKENDARKKYNSIANCEIYFFRKRHPLAALPTIFTR